MTQDDRDVDAIVESFIKNGFKAVRYDDERAMNPKYIVVTKTGIQTPFFCKLNVRDTACVLGNIINKTKGVIPFSFYWGVRLCQLTPVAKGEFRSVVSNFNRHPDPEKFDKIMEKRGVDFFESMLNEAYASAVDLSYYDKKQSLEEDFLGYNGRTFAESSEYVYSYKNRESRAVIYAAIDFSTSHLYARQPWIARKDIADISHEKNCIETRYQYNINGRLNEKWGIIQVYKGLENVSFHKNSNAERGLGSTDISFLEHKDLEIVIVPEKNELIETLICFNDRVFEMPKNDEKWQDFMELTRVSYNEENILLEKRRGNTLKLSFLNNNKPISFNKKGKILSSSIDNENLGYFSKLRKKVRKIINSKGSEKIEKLLKEPLIAKNNKSKIEESEKKLAISQIKRFLNRQIK